MTQPGHQPPETKWDPQLWEAHRAETQRKNRQRGIIVAAAVGVLVVVAGIASLVGGDDEEREPAAASSTTSDAPEAVEEPAAPEYRIVSDDEVGLAHDVLVAVPDTTDLDRVFEAVIDEVATEDAGWFVSIICEGGVEDDRTDGYFNVGFGRHAVGNEGEARTGLADGESEFSATGSTCDEVAG